MQAHQHKGLVPRLQLIKSLSIPKGTSIFTWLWWVPKHLPYSKQAQNLCSWPAEVWIKSIHAASLISTYTSHSNAKALEIVSLSTWSNTKAYQRINLPMTDHHPSFSASSVNITTWLVTARRPITLSSLMSIMGQSQRHKNSSSQIEILWTAMSVKKRQSRHHILEDSSAVVITTVITISTLKTTISRIEEEVALRQPLTISKSGISRKNRLK